MPSERYALRLVRSVSLRALSSLDEVSRARIVETVRLRDASLADDDVDGVARVLHEQLGLDLDDVLDEYAITRVSDDVTLYQTWAVLGEQGIVFPIGSSEPTPVFFQQRHFWSVDPDDADAVALANDLNASARF